MPLQATSGAASYDAFGGGVPVAVNYIEDVFSTYLYTGNGSTQTITNGIDLSTKGGLVWTKDRNSGANHQLFDTSRGLYKRLATNSTAAEYNYSPDGLTAFNSNGFTMTGNGDYNSSGYLIASWTFRKQPKFFDVVTFSGTGSVQNISHNLGSVPACMIIKDTTNAGSAWAIYHTSLGNTQFLQFTASAAGTSSGYWNNTSPTSTQFTVGTNGNVNQSGATYVAYLFAHNAGGFGLSGTENVVSCGSFTTDGSGAYSVTLGYEPQFVLMKRTDSTGDWLLMDNMRGMPVGGNDAILRPNTSGAETQTFDCANPTATGFYESTGSLGANRTFIYIAIRRGPMKVPTSGTSVFAPSVQTGVNTSTGQFITTGFPPDLSIEAINDATSGTKWTIDRLRGNTQFIGTNTSSAESNLSPYGINFTTSNVGVQNLDYGTTSNAYVNWLFRRAPSFFDEVCFTGTGGVQALTHNLTVVPELILCKRRSAGADSWRVYSATVGNTACLILNGTNTPITSDSFWNNTSPTTTQFTTASHFDSATNYVAYLFATAAGVSKVGSYTGNGSTQTIDCGFGAGGARFVLIKRTDSTGDWYTYDTARGMTVLTDPYLLLNSTAAETATLGSVTTVSTGFALNSSILAAINVSGGSYIFFAVA